MDSYTQGMLAGLLIARGIVEQEKEEFMDLHHFPDDPFYSYDRILDQIEDAIDDVDTPEALINA